MVRSQECTWTYVSVVDQRQILSSLGSSLRSRYADAVPEPMPTRLQELVRILQNEDAGSSHAATTIRDTRLGQERFGTPPG
jgi:hypothetical protein